MKDFWLQHGNIICQIVFYSFGLLWFSLNWYIGACSKMLNYKKQIDEKGYIVNGDVHSSFFDFFKIRYIFSSIPDLISGKKYYKNEVFKRETKKVKSYRRFYIIAFPLYFLILLPIVIYFVTKYD